MVSFSRQRRRKQWRGTAHRERRRTTYPDGWRDYRAVASWNRRDWERIPTRYDGQVLTISLPPAPGPSYIAYFEPYSWERHLALLADCISRGARLRRLGASIQGRDIDALVVGNGAAGMDHRAAASRRNHGRMVCRRAAAASARQADASAQALRDARRFTSFPT